MAPIPVIIDTDPGVDDIIAILLALASPELEIIAFLVSYGNTDRDSSVLNIFKAYQAVARHLEAYPNDASRFPNYNPAKPPLLLCAAARPLEGELHSAQYFHGRDGLAGISERHPDLNVDDVESFNGQHKCVQLEEMTPDNFPAIVSDLLRQHPPRSVTYIALGPLTNLAHITRHDPAVINERIGRVVCMGGALDVPGNTTPCAEFNFYADPFAVKRLLLDPENPCALPVDRFILLPLDITTPHELRFSLYKSKVDPEFENTAHPSRLANGKSPLTHFTSAFLERTREVMMEFGNDAIELHDIVAVWCAIENPPGEADPEATNPCSLGIGWRARKRIFDIERYGELTRGMLVVDRRVDASAYAPGANRAQVQKELGDLHCSEGLWESTAVPAQVDVEEAPAVRGSCLN
ncbi:uridine nucleosidase [Coprinopsis cinerea AmutBmut pab1-1]|nr:uridine nucleosidase [Coprinopsis cinerea AmutBmut pab1-1]